MWQTHLKTNIGVRKENMGIPLYSRMYRLVMVMLLGIIQFQLTGCSKSSTSSQNSDGNLLYYRGKVTANAGTQKRSAASGPSTTVTAARIQGDGSLEVISDSPVSVDAKGYYVISIDAEAEAEEIVILADQGSKTLQAVVSSSGRFADTVLVQPLSEESSLEAGIYLSLMAEGKTDISYGDIALAVSAELAAIASASADLADSVKTVVETSLRSAAEMMTSLGVSAEQQMEFAREKTKVQAEYEQETLLNLDSPVGLQNITSERLEGVIKAVQTADISLAHYAWAQQAAFESGLEASSKTSAELRFNLLNETAKLQAVATRAATEAGFTAGSAENTIVNAVVTAGDQLQTQVEEAKDVESLIAAFTEYNQEAYTQMLLAFNTEARALAMIAEGSSLRKKLEGELALASSQQDINKAYHNFYTGVNAELSSELSGEAEEKVTLLSDMMGILSRTRVASTIDVGIMAYISGEIQPAAEDVSVELLQRQLDGTLKVISETATSAKGKFVLGTHIAGASHLIVRALNGTDTLLGVVSAITTKADTVFCRPLNTQSSAEASVWLDIQAKAEIHTGPADISLGLHTEAALQIKTDASLAAQISKTFEARAKTMKSILTDVYGYSETQVQTAAHTEAQIEYEAALHAAGSDTAKIKAAGDALLDAVTEGYTQAGLSLQKVSLAAEAGFQAALKVSTQMSSNARASLFKKLSFFRAHLSGKAHEASFNAVDAAKAHVEAVNQASASLKADLEAATSVDIMLALFAAYNQSVYSELLASLESNATAIATIAEGTSLRSELTASLEAATVTEAVIQAYSEFYTGVQAKVESEIPDAKASLSQSLAATLSSVSQEKVVSEIEIGIKAVITGKVTGEATVSLFEIQSDGKLVSLGNSTTANSSGEFSLSATKTSNLRTLIEATSGNNSYRAVISSHLSKGDTIKARPLTEESSQEAAVWLYMLAHMENHVSGYADVAAAIGEEVASELAADASLLADAAADIESAVAAEHIALLKTNEVTEAQLSQLAQLRETAQVHLETQLAEAGDDSEKISSAMEAHFSAWINSIAEAGISPDKAARSSATAFKALKEKAKGSLQLALLKGLAWYRAKYLQITASENIIQSGGNATSGLIRAGTQLEADIRSVTSVNQLQTKFNEYHQSVYNEILIQFNTHAGVLATLLESTDARQLLSLVEVTDIESLAAGYGDFYSQIETEAQTALNAEPVQLENLVPLVCLLAETELTSQIEIEGKGYITGSLGQTLESGTVALAKITGSGHLEFVSGAIITDSSEGSFVVTGQFTNMDSLFIVAHNNGDSLFAALEEPPAEGDTVGLGTLSEELSAEALVWIQVLSQNLDSIIQLSDVRYYVSGQASADIKSSLSARAAFTATVKAALEAEKSYLENSVANITAQAQQSILEARAEARKTLVAAHKAAGEKQEDIDAAFTAYHQATVEAYGDTQVSLKECAASLQAEARIWGKFSDSLSTEAFHGVVAGVYKAQAYAMNAAVKAEFTAASASEVILNTVDSAGEVLMAGVASATDTEAIKSALTAYHQTIAAQLAATLSLQATALATLDTNISSGPAGAGASAGTRAGLNADLSASATAEAVVSAIIDFEGAILSQAQGALTTASQAEVEFSAAVLFMSHLSL